LIAEEGPIAAVPIGLIADALLRQRPGPLGDRRARRGGLAAAASGTPGQALNGADQLGGRPAKRRAPGSGVHPVVHTARLNADRDKSRYPSCAAARMVSPGRRLWVYQCGDYWHLTSIRSRDRKEPPR
jgi:hypothetical protein